MDWDLGKYEYVASTLLPAASRVVQSLGVQQGEQILDVGCGTGNASLLCAELGAEVTGADPAPRLLSVARETAESRGLEVRFTEGAAESLPFPDHSFDAVVSVFGVIFTPDPPGAATQITRVLRPTGRLVLAAWQPDGALAAQGRIRREAISKVSSTAGNVMPFEWFSPDALTELFGPQGFVVRLSSEQLNFAGPSPEEFAEREWENNPLWIDARAILEPKGLWDVTRSQSLESLKEVNEDRTGFRVTSYYIIATLTREIL